MLTADDCDEIEQQAFSGEISLTQVQVLAREHKAMLKAFSVVCEQVALLSAQLSEATRAGLAYLDAYRDMRNQMFDSSRREK